MRRAISSGPRWVRLIVSQLYRTEPFGEPAAAFHAFLAPRGCTREVSRRPRPLEVEPADAAVAVEDFAGEVQAGDAPRSHRAVIDFAERHAAGGDLGVVPAAM